MDYFSKEIEKSSTEKPNKRDYFSEEIGNQAPKQTKGIMAGLGGAWEALTKPYAKQESPIVQALASSLMPIKQISTPKIGGLPSMTFPVPGYMAGGVIGQQATAKSISELTSPLALAGTALGLMGDKSFKAEDINKGLEAFRARPSPTELDPNSEMAGNLVNSLIKPLHKQYAFGKNPGLGVAREGITDTSLSGLQGKVNSRMAELNNEIKNIRSSGDYVDKTIDGMDALEPFSDALTELGKAPNVHKEEINRIKDIMTDIGSFKDKSIDQLNLSEAYELKGILKNMQSWKSESEGGKMINSALRQSYHNIDKAIDTIAPELAGYNERLSNLISASQAIEHRIEALRNVEPSSWRQIADLPFRAFKSTAVKTNLASLLAKKYPALLGK